MQNEALLPTSAPAPEHRHVRASVLDAKRGCDGDRNLSEEAECACGGS